MKELQSGANITLDNQNTETISISWAPEKIQGCDVDASAFLLKANGKVRSDYDFIFYNFPKTKDGTVNFVESENSSKFILQLSKIPSDIEKVAFAVTIHGKASFAQATSLNIQVGQNTNFAPIITKMSERAVIVGELYRRNWQWKFRAIGHGFQGGLEPLVTHFGIDVDQTTESPTPIDPFSNVYFEERQVL